MDDHSLTASPNDSPCDLDSVTEELKVEFARLERERHYKAASIVHKNLGETTFSSSLGIQARRLRNALGRIHEAIESLKYLDGCISAFQLQQRLLFWNAALKFTLHALTKVNALLARALRAILRTPLLLDGPELNGYKHRLR